MNASLIDRLDSNFDPEMKVLEYSDDETSISSMDEYQDDVNNHKITSMREVSSSSSTCSRLLLIDELNPKLQGSTTKRIRYEEIKTTSPSRSTSSLSTKKKMTINSTVPCPCCKSYVHCKKKKSNLIASSPERPSQSALSSLVDYFWSRPQKNSDEGSGNTRTCSENNRNPNASIFKNSDMDPNMVQPSSPACGLSEQFEYTVTKCLMETWLSKKGSGNDIFGSTSWKPRWCQLVLAHLPFYEVQVPLLLVSWHFTMMKPSTIIILDKKMAISIDALNDPGSNEKESTEYVYRFDIVPDNQDELSSRSFSAITADTRNSWVEEINDAISIFERSRKVYRRANSPLSLPPPIPRSNKRYKIDNSELEGLDLVY